MKIEAEVRSDRERYAQAIHAQYFKPRQRLAILTSPSFEFDEPITVADTRRMGRRAERKKRYRR